jgi:CubicO group peptidase (beta-lactamase class C family)
MNPRNHQTLRHLAIILAAVGLLAGPPQADAGGAEPYRGLKPDAFMKHWLVLKSIPIPREGDKVPTDEQQRAAFGRDWLAGAGGETSIKPAPGQRITIASKSFAWQAVASKEDTVDLHAGSDPAEWAVAYAWARIELKQETKGLLGIGSDDAVKVWLNGKVIHDHWIGRGVQVDEDMVPVVLRAGKNYLMLKVLNMSDGWGFACRLMGPDSQASKFLTAIATGGDNESIQRLLDAGLDINSRTKEGLTPWQAARLRGQPDLAGFLAGKGADTNAKWPEPAKLVNALFAHRIKPDGPGAAVLVARDGKILFQKGYGLADIEHHVPVTAETKFRIGSISKQFTAASILKLQEQGKLSVEDKLSKYFPDFPRGDEVKLRHLLTHTSGMHSYTAKPDFMEKVTNAITAEALIKWFENDKFDFDPGQKWAYCNSGFFLLGCIVEKVSGQTYENFLRQTFFEPLGMKNTGVHHSDQTLRHVALGYDGGPKRARNWDMSWAGGAGALYSTVGDLYRWNEGVFHGKVLSERSLTAAFTPVKTAETKEYDPTEGYGYGWAIGKFRGAREISHGGGLNGFVSHLLRMPEKNFTVVVLVNGAPNASPQHLADLATEICLGTELEPRPKSVKIPAGALDLVVGRYDYGQAVLTVEREGDRLFAQLGTQQRFEIFPKSEFEYFWKVADAQVSFVKGPNGKIAEAVHRQNGGTVHAPRLESLKVVSVDPAVYDALVGLYKSDNGDTVGTITREGNRLFGQVQGEGQPKLELLPQSETEFGVREVNAQIIFMKDAGGKVTKVKVIQPGETTEASKVK